MDAARFKCLYGIFIKGSAKDDRCFNIKLLKYFKTQSITKLYVTENKIGHFPAVEIVNGFLHRTQYGSYFCLRLALQYEVFQIFRSEPLVFYDDDVHLPIIFMLTENTFSSAVIIISSPERILYLSLRFAKPLPVECSMNFLGCSLLLTVIRLLS